MVEIRKIIVFIFVIMLFVYLVSRTLYGIKKYELKINLFLIMIIGTGFLTIATLLDTISEVTHNKFQMLQQVCFTLGAIIFIVGIVFWDNYIRETITFLNKVVRTDPMTGAYNRKGIEEAFERIMKTNESFYIMAFDLDNTKKINDKYGHLSGDKYIITSVQIIIDEIGIRGLLGRTGGDEFVALLGHTDENEMESIKLAIKERVSKIFDEEKTSISIGCAMYGKEGETLEQLVKVADIKMYKDKNKNKGIMNC